MKNKCNILTKMSKVTKSFIKDAASCNLSKTEEREKEKLKKKKILQVVPSHVEATVKKGIRFILRLQATNF